MAVTADQIAGQLRQERIDSILLALSDPSAHAPCALAYMLEERGFSTVAIASVGHKRKDPTAPSTLDHLSARPAAGRAWRCGVPTPRVVGSAGLTRTAPCALAYMLEERGFSTVAIASVRAQAEKTRPPRALWTTSQLGRPLDEPGDAAFQRRVLLAALGLLERTEGPVILEDFNEDPPGWQDAPDLASAGAGRPRTIRQHGRNQAPR